MDNLNFQEASQVLETPTNKEGLLLQKEILPILLHEKRHNLLSLSSKHNLRLTCKAGKAAVDHSLTEVFIREACPVLGNPRSADAKTFKNSRLTHNAKKFMCEEYLSTTFMKKLTRIPFKNLEKMELHIISTALELLPAWKQQDKLVDMTLSVNWQYDDHTRSQFKNLWKKFSTAKWPLLERLTLAIIVEDDEEMLDLRPITEVGAAAGSLLSSFPNLKYLNICTRMTLEDIKTLAAVPHNALEEVEVSFVSQHYEIVKDNPVVGFVEAKWPRLQKLTLKRVEILDHGDIEVFVKAPWIKNLKHLSLQGCHICGHGAEELLTSKFNALESLEISACFPDVFLAFGNVKLPKLQSFVVTINDHEVDNDGFSQGLSYFFSTAKLPSLESLSILKSRSSYQSRPPVSWITPPVSADQMELEKLFSTRPNFKKLVLEGISISQECVKFLASGYKHGWDIDLSHSEFADSEFIEDVLSNMLPSFRLSRSEFNDELTARGLYNEVYWYNLLSIEELRCIATSLFLSNLAADLNNVVEPAKAAMAMAMATAGAGAGAGPSVEGGRQNDSERLRMNYQATCEALRKLIEAVSRVNCGVSVGSESGSDSGGVVAGRKSRKRKPESSAAAL